MPGRHFACALLALPLILTACGKEQPADPRTQTPLVRVAEVVGGSDSMSAYTGVVAARVQSQLGFRVDGKVLERLVDTGDSVRRGQVLMRIDPIDLKLQARAAEQAVLEARAQATQTANDVARYNGLVEQGAISASDYDQLKAAADAARAKLKAAQAQAEVASNTSGYSTLIADSDAIVVETLSEPGQVVRAGEPVVRLARSGQREAAVDLPETLRPSIGSTAMAKLYGENGAAQPATLRQLSDAADPVTRTYEARYVLSGALASAPLGSTVTISIDDKTPTKGSASAVQVPFGALFNPGQGFGVWVISGNPAKASWQPVKVLSLSDSSAQVSGKLNRGDLVAALGAHLLHQGEVVNPIKPASQNTKARSSSQQTAINSPHSTQAASTSGHQSSLRSDGDLIAITTAQSAGDRP